MANVTVIGAQWGDEGKGKIVDWLAARADVVVRFQGGHNAGHTLVVGNTTYKLSLLPSGIVTGTLSLIGNGVVLDPWALKNEVERLEGQGVSITPENFGIADNCALILPLHGELDVQREAAAGKGKIGTTGRGIGPAYEDKVGRRAIRVCDLAHLDELEPQLDRLCAHHDALRAGFGEPPVDRAALLDALRGIAPFVLQFAQPVWRRLNEEKKAGSRILFEGAQGVLLDVDHGTYPFVTSSNTVSGTVASGSGLGPNAAGFVLGIVKAYTTRVGSGPFPTELDDDDGKRLGERGHEFGTVTGRQRRCGWFDAVLVRQSCAISGVTGIALTKLDVLDGFETIRICTGYRLRGKDIDYLPSNAVEQAECEPIYEDMPGWSETTAGARSWAQLPAQAIKYIRRIEELIGTPVASVSTSPERDDTILVRDPFADSAPNPSRKREGSETCRAAGVASRSWVGIVAFALAACAQTPPPEPVARPVTHRPLPAQPVADLVVVDKSERTLWVYARGVEMRRYTGLQFGDQPVGAKEFEGDEKTPEGRYVIDYRNPNSRYHLSLHISYPNERDVAHAWDFNRSAGGEIFIHGSPNGMDTRPPGDWTDGCIALSNAEIEELWRLVRDGTPIEIRP